MRHLVMTSAFAALLCACSVANGGNGGSDGAAAGQSAAGARTFQVGEFSGIRSSGSHEVIVTVGGAPAVRAEGDPEALDRLDIQVDGETLEIGTRRGNWVMGSSRGVRIHVTAPRLESASLQGSGDITVDAVQAGRFEGSVAGSGDLEIARLQAPRARFAIAGSGNIRAAGQGEEADISIAGSGDVELGEYAVRRASVSVAGSGDVNLRASEAVGGSIMGSGNLRVDGSARCSVSRMGSGDIRCGG